VSRGLPTPTRGGHREARLSSPRLRGAASRAGSVAAKPRRTASDISDLSDVATFTTVARLLSFASRSRDFSVDPLEFFLPVARQLGQD
jgi:hypothetical protein